MSDRSSSSPRSIHRPNRLWLSLFAVKVKDGAHFSSTCQIHPRTFALFLHFHSCTFTHFSQSPQSSIISKMAYTDVKVFRFLDIPAELRSKVYAVLLCSFGEPTTNLDDDYNPRLCAVSTSSINTAILRTCNQVHREAYDVMVKTNRFVQVKYTNGIDLYSTLVVHRIPVLLMCECDFQSFLLRLALTCTIDLVRLRHRLGPVTAYCITMFAQDLKLLGSGIPSIQSEYVQGDDEVSHSMPTVAYFNQRLFET
jgi:hypothetical protein